MSNTRSPTRSSEDIVDSTPFLGNTGTGAATDEFNSGRRFVRRQSLRQAARFLRQASGRRMMREPSMVVRETAAEQLEERQSDWAYSKPVVILDMVWNFAFVVVAATVLFLSRKESPEMPLRLWIIGYAMQCVLHMVCVCVEYRRRRRIQRSQSLNGGGEERVGSSGNLSSPSREGSSHYVTLGQLDEDSTSVAKHLESANTMFSFIWWIIGFYWVSAGSQSLVEESPLLYWLCIIFLGFDVFFVVFCVALACIIGIAVCCCLPCIIALLYAVADQEGASKEDIEQLSKYKFRKVENNEKLAGNTQGPVGGVMTECRSDSPSEHVLAEEDAECCICLSSYDDGVELRQLPCGHHFHCSCVDKWLYINATCPLCKYNILKSSNLGQEEV
ncbi:E3 ubiquitin-protein ligase At1g12760 [Arachis duranensis]|uniref:RING-type E3 ubiquitin transferase n=1 Tax=Arachis duranensis TaxID=130453 RepID=A0A6P4DD27_ARADU|nr:E3 ubiquitin-protein ligase At1g12760 [Arachis duranensis]XP_057761480.1 E3 ubiquitin-protein ligase At1g12760-like [Arachis stenosperma]